MSLISIFLASLLGSSHCIGMCGGIVLLYSQNPNNRFSSHLAYNFGRFNSYLLLGALAGFLGKTLNLSTVALGLGKTASLVFGVFLICWGLLVVFKGHLPEPSFPLFPNLQTLYRRIHRNDGDLPPSLLAYLLGLLSTLLPCGWLYMYAAIAASSGSVLWGMAIMAVFWIGTLPYLLSVGLGAQSLLGPLRKRIPVITGVLIIAAGVFSISQHLFAFGAVEMLSGGSSENLHHHHH